MPVAALVLDATGIFVFCALGRRSHAEGITLLGVWHTAWPFLSGAAVGWLLGRGWREPLSIRLTGVPVWICTVALGMILRRVSSQGVAPSFIVVASTVTALLLLGWRLAANKLLGASKS